MLLVYDGDCGFCRMCLDLARKHLPYMPRVSAWQGLDLTRHGLTIAQVNESVQLLGPDGLRAHGARAVGVLLAVQPSPLWRILGRITLTPPLSWGAEFLYRLVARYRHRLPGGTGDGTCGIDAK
ncbi:DCC1-like thiol-disulfide oxidoreductase family protein [Sphaerisporangium sp. B11E5]|uniref:thiol-disulfide oxidoreductase DCC family protein n=1 Tax=Sphaerisporangium sp. B11E5 TaxID=3153563 RepID=UPI00325E87A3